jgi:hypothetical protein
VTDVAAFSYDPQFARHCFEIKHNASLFQNSRFIALMVDAHPPPARTLGQGQRGI